MIYTLVMEESLFGVNRDFRRIDATEVSQEIATIQWDTERNTGVIEYTSEVMDSTQVRDFEAEKAAHDAAVANNKTLDDLKPLFKTIEVHRPRRVISSFDRFLPLVDRWQAAEPLPPVDLPAPSLAPKEQRIPLIEVVRLLRQKGIFTVADIEYLKSLVQE